LKKEESGNKYQEYYHVCIHNWEKGTEIVYGRDGDNKTIDIYCMKFNEFLNQVSAGASSSAGASNRFHQIKNNSKAKDNLVDTT